MGRKIRRVPLNWEHPTRPYGRLSGTDTYQPLYDQTYKEAAQEWLDDAILWSTDLHSDLIKDPSLKDDFPFWWDYADQPPNKEFYRSEWTEDNPPIGYQVYETVTEGTPISPVFSDEGQLKVWLLEQDYSEEAVDNFIRDGYAMSMIIKNGMIYADIESASQHTKR